MITGEMLLELCHSYVKAVNKGTVPSIKCAWSYVGMNEGQRAIESSIQAYEQQMHEFVQSAKLQENISVIEQAQEAVYEQILSLFKQKAVGGDVQSFEASLRHEVNKKYVQIKKLFNIHCEALMDKKYSGSINDIKRLNSSHLGGSDAADQEVDKTAFRDQLSSFKSEGEHNPPYFESKQVWILERGLSISAKYAEHSSSIERQELDSNIKVLSEKVHELEQYSEYIKSEK